MGAWGTGPFENDIAADWCGDLDDLPAGRRADAIRATLRSVAEQTDYLDSGDAEEAVAAAFLVASQCPGGEPVLSTYAPKHVPDLTPYLPELRALAVRALDRMVAKDSEIIELWDEVDDIEWYAGVRSLRKVLA